MTAQETVKAICEALIEKKAQGIEVLHVERLTELTEYFVICSATSTTQVKALADNVEWHLKYDHDEMPQKSSCSLGYCANSGLLSTVSLSWNDGV